MFERTVVRALASFGLDNRGTDRHPRQPAPMLLQRADKIRSSPDWLFEPKWDGFRVLASVRDGSVRLISRNGHPFTHLFGPITEALWGSPPRSSCTARWSASTATASQTLRHPGQSSREAYEPEDT